MAAPAVRVVGLGKRYRLGSGERSRSLRESLSAAMSAPFRRSVAKEPVASTGNGAHVTADGWIWALKDVSCEIPQGEAIGIIGSNGAGKSTLLKILSRITEPTEGLAQIRGRVGSLLEVGTGFHPELTGRENIFLNGAILGMTRSEIQRRFDEIVAFAEVEPFIDTPVKRYSSGMYLRLAFAVAAHLDVDVLAVDEVLAVGDASFQKKCIGKIQEVRSRQGRTVLFVSHNLGSVRLLSDSCLLLHQGRLVEFGRTEDVVTRYLRAGLEEMNGGFADLSGPEARRGTQKRPELNVVFQSLRLKSGSGETTNVFFERDPITVELTFRSKIHAKSIEFILMVLSLDGSVIFSNFSGRQFRPVGEGVHQIVCHLSPNILRPGSYKLRLYLLNVHWQDVIPEAAAFHIQPSPAEGDELRHSAKDPGLLGVVRVEYPWSEIVEVGR